MAPRRAVAKLLGTPRKGDGLPAVASRDGGDEGGRQADGDTESAAAGVALRLTAAARTNGHFAPVPPNSPLETITEEMAAVRVPMGLGMTPSILDIFGSVSLSVSILLVWAGRSTLTVAAHGSRRDVQRRAWSGLLTSAALALLCWNLRVPPPLISFGVITLLFAVAAATATDRA